MSQITGPRTSHTTHNTDRGQESVHDRIGPQTHYGKSHAYDVEPCFSPPWDDKRGLDILEWLAAPDHTTCHAEASTISQQYTGAWFLQEQQFLDWLAGRNPILFVTGMSGSGKTILMSTVVNAVDKHCLTTPNSGYAYFYFDFRRCYSTEDFLRSLVIQLSIRLPTIPPSLHELWRLHQDADQVFLSSELVVLIRNLVSLLSPIFVLVDALDECRDPTILQKCMEEMLCPSLPQLRFIATSRPNHDLETFFSRFSPASINLCPQTTQRDIELYISERLQNDRHLTNWDKKLKEEIKAALLMNSGGIFRLVTCQMDELRWCPSLPELKKTLQHLPSDLHKVYDKILYDMDEHNRRYVYLLFQWLSISQRPFTVPELQDALAVDLHGCWKHPFFSPEVRSDIPETALHNLCPSLLAFITQGQKYGKQNLTAQCLTFAHQSVRDYILSSHSPLSQIGITTQHAHQFVLDTCVRYLFHVDRHLKSREEVDLEGIRQEFPLLDYAAQRWADHLELDTRGYSGALEWLFALEYEPNVVMEKPVLPIVMGESFYDLETDGVIITRPWHNLTLPPQHRIKVHELLPPPIQPPALIGRSPPLHPKHLLQLSIPEAQSTEAAFYQSYSPLQLSPSDIGIVLDPLWDPPQFSPNTASASADSYPTTPTGPSPTLSLLAIPDTSQPQMASPLHIPPHDLEVEFTTCWGPTELGEQSQPPSPLCRLYDILGYTTQPPLPEIVEAFSQYTPISDQGVAFITSSPVFGVGDASGFT